MTFFAKLFDFTVVWPDINMAGVLETSIWRDGCKTAIGQKGGINSHMADLTEKVRGYIVQCSKKSAI